MEVKKAQKLKSRWGRAAAATLTASALIFSQACFANPFGSSGSSEPVNGIDVNMIIDGNDASIECGAHGIPEGQGGTSIPSIYRNAAVPSFHAAAEGVELGKSFYSDGMRSNYHVFTRGVDFSKPVGLVVRLHGDGAREYDVPSGMTSCLADVAARHNAIYVVPKAPDHLGTVTWWENMPKNRGWLNALLDREIYRDYNIDRSRVWWMGYSGGAELLTYSILANQPDSVAAGAIMVGGGGAPQALEKHPTPEQKGQMDLTWIVGKSDNGAGGSWDALTAGRSGAAFYRDQGFNRVQEVYPDGHDHYSLPQAQILDQKLSGQSVNVVR